MKQIKFICPYCLVDIPFRSTTAVYRICFNDKCGYGGWVHFKNRIKMRVNYEE